LASLIIDGYNLIGIQHRDIDPERKRLVHALVGYRKRKGHDITVVFDGWRGGPGPESRSATGGVEVVYSGLGERADSAIARRLRDRARQWIVVSSDREVQRAAWAEGAVPVSSEEFLSALEGRALSGEGAEGEDDYPESRRKGSPRQPSRKDRERERALRKL
jgi:hypothetical protein